MNIINLLESGANIKLEVTTEDLSKFAVSIVERTIATYTRTTEQNAPVVEETYLNTKQVRERLHVCEGTLNTWAKRGYLVPVKVGNKNMYPLTDVQRIQHGSRSESVTEYCKRQKAV